MEARHKTLALTSPPPRNFAFTMASFAALGSLARRSGRMAAPLASRHTQKRGMALGGSHGPPPDWQGVDKVVRSYFPEDYQRTLKIDSF